MAGGINMYNLLDLIKKHLDLKILIVLTIGVALVMGAVISLSVKNQREQIREENDRIRSRA